MIRKLVLTVAACLIAFSAYAGDLWIGGKEYITADIIITDGARYGVTIQSTNALTLTPSHHTIACNISTCTDMILTLPDAKPVGQEYVVYFLIDNGNDVLVDAAAGDTFDENNNRITFGDANDSAIIQSVAANRWLLIYNNGGSLGGQ